MISALRIRAFISRVRLYGSSYFSWRRIRKSVVVLSTINDLLGSVFSFTNVSLFLSTAESYYLLRSISWGVMLLLNYVFLSSLLRLKGTCVNSTLTALLASEIWLLMLFVPAVLAAISWRIAKVWVFKPKLDGSSFGISISSDLISGRFFYSPNEMYGLLPITRISGPLGGLLSRSFSEFSSQLFFLNLALSFWSDDLENWPDE